MSATPISALAIARQPQQARSRKRFERILEEAEALLGEVGLQGFSIPVIAQRLNYNRRTIYALFPTPHAVLNELTRRYILQLEDALLETAAQARQAPVQDLLRAIVLRAVRFHNEHPIGRLLILGGAVTDRNFRVQESTIAHLGELGGQLLRSRGYAIPSGPPRVPVVAVELGLACMRLSQSLHAEITAAYAEEAVYVMQVYLAARLDGFPAPALPEEGSHSA